MVDASYFFKARKASWKWQNLTSLALTARVLAPGARIDHIDNMLVDAADAALKMPLLQTMEIWNGREGLAMLFRYQRPRDPDSAVVTLRGTFRLALSPVVTRAWDAVAFQHRHGRPGRVVFESSLVDAAIIGSHSDAICHLGLSTQVIRPVSLLQILKEHQSRAGVYDGRM